MESFKVVAKIKYKEEFFYVLINSSCQKYFIKEFEDGSITYPTEDEFIELSKIFDQKQILSTIHFGKNYKISPKVIMRNKQLLGFGMALAMFGSSLITFPLDDDHVEIVSRTNYSGTENFSLVEQSYINNGYDIKSLYGYENRGVYRIHKIAQTKKSAQIIECQNFDEFARHIHTKSNPTYADLRCTINNNNNINQQYKNWLLEGIDNLEKNMPNVNLTVLNFNINRLQIIEKTSEELNKEKSREMLAGRFDEKTGKVYLVKTEDDKSNKFILFHEVLGHGISEASFETKINDSRIIISDSILVMRAFEKTNENGSCSEVFYLGQGHEEGKADQVAKYAMGEEKIVGHPYIEQSEQLRIMCESVELSLEDYISNGGAEILSQKMQENDVDNSIVYIMADDIFVSAMKSDELEVVDKKCAFKENMIAFFKDYADNKIKNGVNRDEVVKNFSRILLNGGEYIYSTFNGEEINYAKLKKDIDKVAKNIERDI